jgi:hypothetical protein
MRGWDITLEHHIKVRREEEEGEVAGLSSNW